MIVLDENLQVLRLDNPIAAWYPGRVCYITDLRPASVIKDEAVPGCLQQVKGATFVTTNVVDFWRRIRADAPAESHGLLPKKKIESTILKLVATASLCGLCRTVYSVQRKRILEQSPRVSLPMGSARMAILVR